MLCDVENPFYFQDEKFSQQHKASLSERKKWIHDPSSNKRNEDEVLQLILN
jgi:hypothetical protein